MFVPLIIQHALRMRGVILSPVACPAVQKFSKLSHKLHDFRKKRVMENKMCFFFRFVATSVCNISHSKKN